MSYITKTQKRISDFLSTETIAYYSIVCYFIYRLVYDIDWSSSVSTVVFSAQKIIQMLMLLLCCLYYLKKSFELPYKKVYIAISLVIVGFLLLLLLKKVNSKRILITFFLGIMAYKLRFKHLVKTNLAVITIGLIITIIGYFCGFTIDYLKSGSYGTGHSLGYTHPNILSFHVFLIMISVWYLYLKKKPLLFCFISLIISFVVYSISLCRTVLFLELLFCSICFLFYLLSFIRDTHIIHKALTNKIIYYAIVLLPFLLCMFSIYMCLISDSFSSDLPFFKTFFIRFVLGKQALDKVGISFFGTDIYKSSIYTNWGGVLLDNCYIRLLVESGIVITLPMLLWMSGVLKKCIDEENRWLLLIEIILLIYGTMEIYAIDFNYNFALFSLFATTEFAKDNCNSSIVSKRMLELLQNPNNTSQTS